MYNNIIINYAKKNDFKIEFEREQHYKDYFKNYYEENKEQIKKKLYETKRCECYNMDVRKYKFQRHCMSKRHKKNDETVSVVDIHDEL